MMLINCLFGGLVGILLLFVLTMVDVSDGQKSREW